VRECQRRRQAKSLALGFEIAANDRVVIAAPILIEK
jgi:hypothetical protein